MPLPISKKPYFSPSSETRILVISSLVVFLTLNEYSSPPRAIGGMKVVTRRAQPTSAIFLNGSFMCFAGFRLLLWSSDPDCSGGTLWSQQRKIGARNYIQ